ncbi:hypothetical protein JW916_06215 [Candidatus Sumerlaeota bacterium]|nr:hypothetical protein [Candidatus Sumerlaeota bacterium]
MMHSQTKPRPFYSLRKGFRCKADGVLVLGLLLALAGGVFLRFLLVSDVQFTWDHAMGLVLGAKWLESPGIATHGMDSSIGIPNPPAMVYFFAMFYGVSGGDPHRATIGVIVWNLVGLGICAVWLFRKRTLFGRVWTFWILAFVCLNPWAVVFSRRIWAPDFLLPLVVGTIAGFSTIWSERWDWRKIAVGFVCLGVASQVHLSVVFWGAALGVGLLAFWPARHRRRLLPFLCLGVGIAALLYLPWVLYLLRERPVMSSGIPSPLGRNAGAALWHLLSLCLGVGWPELRFLLGGGDAVSFFNDMGVAWRTLQVVSAGTLLSLLALGSIRLALGAVRRTASPLLCALAVSLVLFFPFLRMAGVSIHQHYGAVLLLPVALICGVGWGEAERLGNRRLWVRRSLVAAAALVLAICVWSTAGFMWRIHATEGTVWGYGPTLRWSRRWVASLPNRSALRPDAALEIQYLRDFLDNGRIDPDDYLKDTTLGKSGLSLRDSRATESSRPGFPRNDSSPRPAVAHPGAP